MRHEGLRSAATTTIVAAGRISPKSSPWTFPTASQSAACVRYMRVRTTSPNLTLHGVDADRGLLLIKGAVPGPSGGLVLVRSAVKSPASSQGDR